MRDEARVASPILREEKRMRNTALIKARQGTWRFCAKTRGVYKKQVVYRRHSAEERPLGFLPSSSWIVVLAASWSRKSLRTRSSPRYPDFMIVSSFTTSIAEYIGWPEMAAIPGSGSLCREL